MSVEPNHYLEITRSHVHQIYRELETSGKYKRQNKLFHFHKTFCSKFGFINTKQNVHFASSYCFSFPVLFLYLQQFSIGKRSFLVIKEDYHYRQLVMSRAVFFL